MAVGMDWSENNQFEEQKIIIEIHPILLLDPQKNQYWH